jgi:Fe-S-cluster-containing dehydrogenase component
MPEFMVLPEKCVGCRICELICSATYEGKYNPKLSRIRIITVHPFSDIPIVCLHCKKPKCMEACPMGAMTWDRELSIVRIDAKLCNGCKNCIQACPFKAISFHWINNVAIKCELCNGKPKCVETCPASALMYTSPSKLNFLLKQEYAEKRAKGVERILLRK